MIQTITRIIGYAIAVILAAAIGFIVLAGVACGGFFLGLALAIWHVG